MEYLTLQKSCLITILLPLNFAIGTYTSGMRKLGKKKNWLYVVFFVASIVISVFLLMNGRDPYIPFILIGGVVVGIIQQSYYNRKADHLLDETDRIFRLPRIFWGMLLLILPHTLYFQKFLLSECGNEVKYICIAVYTIWGIGEALFPMIFFKKGT